MTEQLECHDHWQAIDPTRNVARDYHLVVTHDLFGWTIVERRWGRIGGKSRETRNSFPNAALAWHFVRTVRRRRASAKDRIGVCYQLLS